MASSCEKCYLQICFPGCLPEFSVFGSDAPLISPPRSPLITDLDAETLKLVQLIEDINRSGKFVKTLNKIFANAEVQKFVKDLTETIYDHILVGGSLTSSPASEYGSLSNSFVQDVTKIVEQLSNETYHDSLYVSTENAVSALVRNLLQDYVQKPAADTDSQICVPASSFSTHEGHPRPAVQNTNAESLIRDTESSLGKSFVKTKAKKYSHGPSSTDNCDFHNPATNDLASALITRLVKKGTKESGQALTIDLEHLESKIVQELNTNYSDVQICPDKLEKFVKKVTKHLFLIYGATSKKLRVAMNDDKNFCGNLIVCLKLQLAIHASTKNRENVFQRMFTSLRTAVENALGDICCLFPLVGL